MHIPQMAVMLTMLAMTMAQNSSESVSAANPDISNTEDDQHYSPSPEKAGYEVQEAVHQIQDNSSSGETGILLDSVETSNASYKYLSKLPFKIDIMFSEALSTHEESTSTFEAMPNRTNSANIKKRSQDDTVSAFSFASDGSVALSNSSACFCNQCIFISDTEVNNGAESTFPECFYVKRFLNSGCLNTGQLALKVLQQCIIAEEKSVYHSQHTVHHNNTHVVLLPETHTIKANALKQADCVLKSLELVYDWRKNYDALKNNIVGDSDRHFDPGRYRKLLSSLEATLNSLPEFLDAVNQLHAVGDSCLDIIWAPVFASALGRNSSAFESFLLEEQSKLKNTLWTGLMFRDYLDPIVYSLLTLFGVLSNGSLLLMFVRYKEMQTQRNVLLLNLVVVDLMNLAAVAPLYLLSKYGNSNLYAGELGCSLFLCYRIIVRYNIEFSLVALTIQRYSAITTHRLSVRTRAVFYILGVWVVSLIATLPHIVAFVIRDYSCFSFRREPGEIDFLIDHALMMLLSLIVPAVVFILSMLMAKRLRRSIREIPGEGQQTLQRQEFTRSRSARVVVALAVVFAFTHTPRAFWYGTVPWSKIDRQSATFLWIDGSLNYLYYLNSSLNPCAMYLSSSVFRKMFRRCFGCFSRDHRTKDSSQTQRTQQCYISQNCRF